MEPEISKPSFEIKLIIIAILIPVFLESFPNLIDKILPFLPVGNLKLDIVTIISIILGTIWFLVLILGLIQFNSESKKLFDFSFRIGAAFTILGISLVLNVYLIYLLNLWIGNEKIINRITAISGVISGIYFGHILDKMKKEVKR
ncbi:MAG: hypothetical protein PHH00_02840 [Candidatus Nanoarchaeia archaeon]|nr:hypothetical protein [Candidatus Nanoarchaeia archaeon]